MKELSVDDLLMLIGSKEVDILNLHRENVELRKEVDKLKKEVDQLKASAHGQKKKVSGS